MLFLLPLRLGQPLLQEAPALAGGRRHVAVDAEALGDDVLPELEGDLHHEQALRAEREAEHEREPGAIAEPEGQRRAGLGLDQRSATRYRAKPRQYRGGACEECGAGRPRTRPARTSGAPRLKLRADSWPLTAPVYRPSIFPSKATATQGAAEAGDVVGDAAVVVAVEEAEQAASGRVRRPLLDLGALLLEEVGDVPRRRRRAAA